MCPTAPELQGPVSNLPSGSRGGAWLPPSWREHSPRGRADSQPCLHLLLQERILTVYTGCYHRDRTFLEGSFSLSCATDISLRVFFWFSICISFLPKTGFTSLWLPHKQQLSGLMRRGSASYGTQLHNKDLQPIFWPHTTREILPLPYTGI